MPRFFVENLDTENPAVTGSDAGHIKRSLRMKTGEEIVVCDTAGRDYICVITDISDERIGLEIKEVRKSDSEPDVSVTLFQCNPKGDKLETVIQKTVELGIYKIVPVVSSRCVSRPDAKSAAKKRERYQKIADSAAKQSGRGILPQVADFISFREMCGLLPAFDKALFFYEGGGAPLRDILSEKDKSVAVVIGPEGGFDIAEVELAVNAGAVACGLGKRILRTETAPVAALSCIMMLSGNLE